VERRGRREDGKRKEKGERLCSSKLVKLLGER